MAKKQIQAIENTNGTVKHRNLERTACFRQSFVLGVSVALASGKILKNRGLRKWGK